jgi:hypothetical protein
LVEHWKADGWQAAGLPGVDCGRQLYASGELRRLANSGTRIAEVLDDLGKVTPRVRT